MDESQQTLFSGFKKPLESAKEGPQDSIPGTKTNSAVPIPIGVKQGVIFVNLRPEIYSLFPLLAHIFGQYGKACIITSANDGVHKENSKHYSDLAIDLRTHHLLDTIQKYNIWKELKANLEPSYVVLFENEGKDSEHIHLGYHG